VYLNIDAVATQITHYQQQQQQQQQQQHAATTTTAAAAATARVRGLASAGFFLDFQTAGGGYADQMLTLAQEQASE
jgi:hypothetical protein